MAKQRYVNTRIWRDSYIENLDPSEKLLFLYFLTNPDTNISGIYEIPIKIISIDVGFEKEMTVRILKRFEKDGKIKYEKGWIAIKNFTQHQSLNPKIKKGIETELKNAPADLVKWISLSEGIAYDSLSHLNTNTNTNSNNNTKEEIPGDKSPYSEIIDKYFKLYEAKFNRKPKINGADGQAVKNILNNNYKLDEILDCLDAYINNSDAFTHKQGYTLKYFQNALPGLVLGASNEKDKTDYNFNKEKF